MILSKNIDSIKKYIDDIILREKSIHESHNFENSYPHLVKYRDELLVEGLIAKTLEKSLRGWGEKDQYILNNVEVKRDNFDKSRFYKKR